jgi:rubrerythrin
MSENFYTANASLAGVEHLGTDEMQTIWRVEMAGEHFYNLLAERIDDAEAKDLLRRNAVEERGHARRIARALSIVLGREWEPSAEQQQLLDVPMPPSVDAKLFAGIYQRWADNESDPEVARLLRLNGREETIHANRAKRVLEILSS